MKNKRRLVLAVALFDMLLWIPIPAPYAAQPKEETTHAHEEALTVATEDPVLKEQIAQMTSALEQLHERMASARKALDAATDDDRKTALYAELDGLRKERDTLERLLHELVDEAKATEWTAIDEALRRSRAFERYQERADQKEDNLRERKQ